MQYLEDSWAIDVITKAQSSCLGRCIKVHSISDWYPTSLVQLVVKLKLGKIWGFILPFGGELAVFWVIPAILKGWKLIKEEKPDVIVVFMMPYSVGWVGIILKWLTGVPVILNFDDSPTCTDMSGNVFMSWIHYKMTVWTEDFYIQNSDATIYVSQRNLDRVKSRQSKNNQNKFHLVRYGADPKDFQDNISNRNDEYFQIAYIGVMGGWFEFYHFEEEKKVFWRRLYQFWNDLGQYKVIDLDLKTSSPMYLGQAVKTVIYNHPEWDEKIKIDLYGNPYPKYVTDRALKNQNLNNVVQVHDALPNKEAIQIACSCDLLFMTLPARPDDAEPGGRISAKTYEYLMTDRPILAAISPGENYDYLQGKTGVWIVHPRDVSAMTEVITKLVSEKFSGNPKVCDRTPIHWELSYANRAVEFAQVLDTIVSQK
ncbi:MAG: hypothetical protein J7540_18440 [Roseofilum sp. SID2]|nr:hypothetical protein [Roseofilum sp. SBFL]MBP0014393.1 hypothetical protein [Roseofilum sp. SID3]MBP0025958.1 hypothetical protein [Roseofilum sp. SID2]MBP0036130.1 hypothetical protein [Roseofilum sp. SID1]